MGLLHVVLGIIYIPKIRGLPFCLLNLILQCRNHCARSPMSIPTMNERGYFCIQILLIGRFHLIQRRRSIIWHGKMCVDDSRIGIGQFGFNLETTRFIAVETNHVADLVFVQECNAFCVDELGRIAWRRNVVGRGRTVKSVGTGICSYGFPAVETDVFGLACDVLGHDIALCVGFGIGGGEHVYCFGIVSETKDVVLWYSVWSGSSVSIYFNWRQYKG